MNGRLRVLALSATVLCVGGGGCGGGGGARAVPALATLGVSQGTLTPAFDPGVTVYSVGPSPLPSSVTVTPTTALGSETVTVDGAPTPSGTPSGPISLAMGVNVVSVVVTGPDGISQRTYTVTFDRTSADLLSLAASAGSLAPSFLSGVMNYVVGPTIVLDSSTLTATTADPAATLTVNGDVVSSGAASVPFAVTADLTTVTVVVLARDGSSKTYTVVFDRVDAVFFDDFSGSTLGASWSGTASLDTLEGVPPPSLALLAGQSVEYVGGAVSSTPGVTLTVDVQRDPFATATIRLFDAAQPASRWLSLKLSGATIECEYGNGGAFVQGFQGPIPVDDHLFHRVELRVGPTGTVTFSLDGTTYSTIFAFPVTSLRFSLAHTPAGGGPSDFGRFDDVTLTSP